MTIRATVVTTTSIMAVSGSISTPMPRSMFPICAQTVFITKGAAMTRRFVNTAPTTPSESRKLAPMAVMPMIADVFLFCRVPSPMIRKASAGRSGISHA